MNVILKTIANWFYKHGKANAGMASIRGAYEAPVPQQLQEQDKPITRLIKDLQLSSLRDSSEHTDDQPRSAWL